MLKYFPKKPFLIFLILALIFVLMGGCYKFIESGIDNIEKNTTVDFPGIEKVDELYVVGTGDVGGTFYPVGSAVAEIVNSDIDNIKMIVEATDGSVDNSRLVRDGEIDFGLAVSDLAYKAWKGEEPFSSDIDGDNVTALFATYPSVVQGIALKERGFTKIGDLKGKTVSVGLPGSGSEAASRAILNAAGFNYYLDVTPEFLGIGEGAEAVRDGEVDAKTSQGGLPFAAFTELAETRNVRVLEVEQEIRQKVVENNPWFFEFKIPPNTYKGQEESVDTLAVKCLFLANKETVSEELAYRITKHIWENRQFIIGKHSSLEAMKEDFVANEIPVPLHPGAKKYWEEIGIIE